MSVCVCVYGEQYEREREGCCSTSTVAPSVCAGNRLHPEVCHAALHSAPSTVTQNKLQEYMFPLRHPLNMDTVRYKGICYILDRV